MARITRVEHARKEYKCSKCGAVIKKGDPYVHATPFHRPTIIRCAKCGIESYETSTSEFVQAIGRIQSHWQDDYGYDAQAIADDLQDQYDMAEDSYDQIPENLQYGPTGEMLQERMDMLEDVISDLNEIQDVEDKMQDLEDEVTEDYRRENDIPDDVDLTEEQEGELHDILQDRAESEIGDEIEEALCNLSY